MKKYLAILVALIAVGALVITGCAAPAPAPAPTPAPAPAPAPVEARVLNFNTQTPGPGQAANYAADEWMAAEMAKRSNGRVKIQMFYANALTSGTAGWDATIAGAVDIEESVVGYYPGQFPLTSVAELPLGYPSSFAIVNATTDLYNKYPQVQAEWPKVKLLYFAAPPSFVIGTTKKEIKTNADCQGLTLRTHAGSKAIAEALGAAAKITPITEAYELLSKGAVDGLIVAPEAFPGYHFDELIKYMYDVSYVTSTSCSFIIINKDVFNSLQPQDQQALMDIVNIVRSARAVEWDKINDTATAAWLKLPGRVYNKPSAVDIAAMQVGMKVPIDAWVQKVTATGAPGAEMLQYLRDRITFWSTQPLPTAPWVAK